MRVPCAGVKRHAWPPHVGRKGNSLACDLPSAPCRQGTGAEEVSREDGRIVMFPTASCTIPTRGKPWQESRRTASPAPPLSSVYQPVQQPVADLPARPQAIHGDFGPSEAEDGDDVRPTAPLSKVCATPHLPAAAFTGPAECSLGRRLLGLCRNPPRRTTAARVTDARAHSPISPWLSTPSRRRETFG